MTTHVVPHRPTHVPLHRWPWLWVIVANIVATVVLVSLAACTGGYS